MKVVASEQARQTNQTYRNMLNQSYDQLLEQQKSQLSKINTEISDPLELLKSSVDLIQKNLKELNNRIKKQPFTDQTEEIYFFKKIKPALYSDKIFEFEKYQIEFNKPKGTPETVITYYQAELKYLERFFNLNSFYYHYYRSGFVELDHLYFLRSTSLTTNFMHEVQDNDPGFSTPLDYLFAKFAAYERLQAMIIQEILVLQTPNRFNIAAKERNVNSLQWTGDSINLVEVAYGIWLTGQLNNGNASISEIIKWLEDAFKVNIGRAHRRWTEISQRKRSSYTKFIDRMKESVLERIDNEIGVKS
ncbi:RteC domain-containing protein [Pedobacter sp. P351]|uniref:RteC domain-containing protein n=1 Tax=Pedobacter superstes TaxID=3133441 RepID=UPI0030B525B5